MSFSYESSILNSRISTYSNPRIFTSLNIHLNAFFELTTTLDIRKNFYSLQIDLFRKGLELLRANPRPKYRLNTKFSMLECQWKIDTGNVLRYHTRLNQSQSAMQIILSKKTKLGFRRFIALGSSDSSKSSMDVRVGIFK